MKDMREIGTAKHRECTDFYDDQRMKEKLENGKAGHATEVRTSVIIIE